MLEKIIVVISLFFVLVGCHKSKLGHHKNLLQNPTVTDEDPAATDTNKNHDKNQKDGKNNEDANKSNGKDPGVCVVGPVTADQKKCDSDKKTPGEDEEKVVLKAIEGHPDVPSIPELMEEQKKYNPNIAKNEEIAHLFIVGLGGLLGEPGTQWQYKRTKAKRSDNDYVFYEPDKFQEGYVDPGFKGKPCTYCDDRSRWPDDVAGLNSIYTFEEELVSPFQSSAINWLYIQDYSAEDLIDLKEILRSYFYKPSVAPNDPNTGLPIKSELELDDPYLANLLKPFFSQTMRQKWGEEALFNEKFLRKNGFQLFATYEHRVDKLVKSSKITRWTRDLPLRKDIPFTAKEFHDLEFNRFCMVAAVEYCVLLGKTHVYILTSILAHSSVTRNVTDYYISRDLSLFQDPKIKLTPKILAKQKLDLYNYMYGIGERSLKKGYSQATDVTLFVRAYNWAYKSFRVRLAQEILKFWGAAGLAGIAPIPKEGRLLDLSKYEEQKYRSKVGIHRYLSADFVSKYGILNIINGRYKKGVRTKDFTKLFVTVKESIIPNSKDSELSVLEVDYGPNKGQWECELYAPAEELREHSNQFKPPSEVNGSKGGVLLSGHGLIRCHNAKGKNVPDRTRQVGVMMLGEDIGADNEIHILFTE